MTMCLRDKLNHCFQKMIKTFCDKCEKEIEKNELMGQITYLDRELSLSTDNNIPPKVKQVTKILCERCITKLRKHL